MSIDSAKLEIQATPILEASEAFSDATLRMLSPDDGERLARFFGDLSTRTRSLFAPHPFTREEAHRIVGDLRERGVHDPDNPMVRYVVTTADRIIGYFLVHPRLHDSDRQRYESYGINGTDCASFAPSVSDEFQGRGVGGAAFRVIRAAAEDAGVRCLTLMGGVQARNTIARHYYTALGFQKVGYFQTDVENIDMMLPLRAYGR